jgi:hypothetical protein
MPCSAVEICPTELTDFLHFMEPTCPFLSKQISPKLVPANSDTSWQEIRGAKGVHHNATNNRASYRTISEPSNYCVVKTFI